MINNFNNFNVLMMFDVLIIIYNLNIYWKSKCLRNLLDEKFNKRKQLLVRNIHSDR